MHLTSLTQVSSQRSSSVVHLSFHTYRYGQSSTRGSPHRRPAPFSGEKGAIRTNLKKAKRGAGMARVKDARDSTDNDDNESTASSWCRHV